MTNRLLIILCLFASSPAMAEPAKLSAPDLVIRGQIESSQGSVVNGKPTTIVTLILDANTKVLVFTSQDSMAITTAFTKAALKRQDEIGKILKTNSQLQEEALNNNDFKKADALLKESGTYNKEILALSKLYGVPAVVEGVLEFKEKTWLLSGTIHPIDSETKERAIGTARIRGEATPGEYKVANTISKLAIKSGGMLVVITGKATTDAKIEGLTRASGKVVLGKDGTMVLEADKLEAVKK